jgi:Na+/melibiose symporter-like transporter
MAMVGILFTMPLYFQGVWGEDAMGSGLRLLPLVGGLVVGALPADRVALRIGPNVTVAIGLALLAAGMAVGSTTAVGSGGGFVAAWMALAGLGMGLGLSTAASAALSVLPARSAGIGSGVMQAFQKIGAPLGAAVLGSVLSSGYLSRLDLIGLPGEAAGTVREGLYGGIAVAAQIGSTDLLALVRAAFTHGMDLALVVSAGVAAVGMVLGLWLLPRRGMHGPSAGVETATRSGAIAP